MNLQDAMKLADPELTDALDDIVGEHVMEFLVLKELHPLKRYNPGYVSLSESFWLWRLACDLKPELIVESGTMDGWSAWWLQQGMPQTGLLYTFDPTGMPFCHLARTNHVHYSCVDFSELMLLIHPALAFFDDHQCQRERLEQAAQKGFKDMVFHDVYPDGHLSLWRSGCAGAVHQFPAIREPAVFCRPEHRQHRWLTWVRL